MSVLVGLKKIKRNNDIFTSGSCWQEQNTAFLLQLSQLCSKIVLLLISGKIAKVYMKLLLLMDIIFSRENDYTFSNPTFSLSLHPTFLRVVLSVQSSCFCFLHESVV